VLISVTTKPSYITTYEKYHINHMGIRTPCYTTIKEQNHINHMGIRTPCYTTTKEQNYVDNMGNRTPCYTTMKEQNYVLLKYSLVLLLQIMSTYKIAKNIGMT
jgi:hypothetical protein